jgi:hypothetical protein
MWDRSILKCCDVGSQHFKCCDVGSQHFFGQNPSVKGPKKCCDGVKNAAIQHRSILNAAIPHRSILNAAILPSQHFFPHRSILNAAIPHRSILNAAIA